MDTSAPIEANKKLNYNVRMLLKKKLSRDQIIVLSLGIPTLIVAMGAWLFPDVRYRLQLQRRPVEVSTSSAPQSPVSALAPNPKPSSSQHSNNKVQGSSNVTGNSTKGKANVTGNGNQTGPVAIAPNGIAVAGGSVTNPTVNNYGQFPRRIPADIRNQVVAILKAKPSKVAIEYVLSDDAYQFATDWYNVLQEAGWQVQYLQAVEPTTPQFGIRVDFYDARASQPNTQVSIPDDSIAGVLLTAVLKAGFNRPVSVHTTTNHPQDSVDLIIAAHPRI